KTVTAVLVWATAVSSALGSTPHFVCRCPDGTVKPFCSGQVSSESSCCCNGKCCCSTGDGGCCCKSTSSNGQEQKNAPGCCQQGKPDAVSEAVAPRSGEDGARKAGPAPQTGRAEHLSVSRNCCQKKLAKSEDQTLVRPETKPLEQCEPGSAPLPPLNVGCFIPPQLAARDGWQIYRLPPPTDLVIVLQHFII